MKTRSVSNIMLPKRLTVRGTKFVVLGLVVCLMVFGLSKVSGAAYVYRINYTSADAYFSDTSGCIVTNVSVYAFNEVGQYPPAPGYSLNGATVSISQYDFCTDTQLISAFGQNFPADQDFQVSPNLDSVTLNTTINVFDYISNTSFPVYVQTTWTSTGPLGRSNAHSHDSFGGCNNIFHRNYNVRPVQASATVSDGVTNFTPDGDTLAAELTSEQSGYVACE